LTLLSEIQLAINEASTLNKIPPSLTQEKNEFLYRSYLGLGQYDIVLGEIKDNANTPVGIYVVVCYQAYS